MTQLLRNYHARKELDNYSPAYLNCIHRSCHFQNSVSFFLSEFSLDLAQIILLIKIIGALLYVGSFTFPFSWLHDHLNWPGMGTQKHIPYLRMHKFPLLVQKIVFGQDHRTRFLICFPLNCGGCAWGMESKKSPRASKVGVSNNAKQPYKNWNLRNWVLKLQNVCIFFISLSKIQLQHELAKYGGFFDGCYCFPSDHY